MIVAYALTLALSAAPFNHELPVDWLTDISIAENITLKSELLLNKRKIRRVKRIIRNTEYIFFKRFETGLICDDMGPLKIRIVSKETLRNTDYFASAKPTNFGRYFVSSNTLYIASDVFRHPEWLAHELAHYYYDECDVHFDSIDEEHQFVYAFQDMFENWIRR